MHVLGGGCKQTNVKVFVEKVNSTRDIRQFSYSKIGKYSQGFMYKGITWNHLKMVTFLKQTLSRS